MSRLQKDTIFNKFTVPMTYAKSQSLVSILVSLFTLLYNFTLISPYEIGIKSFLISYLDTTHNYNISGEGN